MGKIKKGIISLDPRTKLLLLIVINIFIFNNSSIVLEGAVMASLVLLLCLNGVYGAAMKSMVLYVLLVGVKYLLLPLCPPFIMASFNIIAVTFRKLIPCVTLGALLVQTTPIRLMMHTLERFHIPKNVVIPIAITIRYFPTLFEEQEAIRDAMKLRNVKGIFKKLEYIYVPIIMSASQTADELSQAITARGIDNPKPKTCTIPMVFHGADYVLMLYAAILVLLAVVL